jgi:methionyl-tRNA formyltransferase
MNVLLLGPGAAGFAERMRAQGDEPLAWQERTSAAFLRQHAVEFVVSYGYRHILRPDVLEALPGRIINLHIAYLPWNRGADPNLWSFVEGTPKGVTIHHVDAGIDTGDVIAQREVALDRPGATLASTYEELSRAMLELFWERWPDIRAGRAPRTPQPAGGSLHRLADRARVQHLLTRGWDTPVAELARKEEP